MYVEINGSMNKINICWAKLVILIPQQPHWLIKLGQLLEQITFCEQGSQRICPFFKDNNEYPVIVTIIADINFPLVGLKNSFQSIF